MTAWILVTNPMTPADLARSRRFPLHVISIAYDYYIILPTLVVTQKSPKTPAGRTFPPGTGNRDLVPGPGAPTGYQVRALALERFTSSSRWKPPRSWPPTSCGIPCHSGPEDAACVGGLVLLLHEVWLFSSRLWALWALWALGPRRHRPDWSLHQKLREIGRHDLRRQDPPCRPEEAQDALSASWSMQQWMNMHPTSTRAAALLKPQASGSSPSLSNYCAPQTTML